ncbi:energy transducer TonB [Bacillus subtilis subsp. subtilis]|nr:energy transducer TonB [Bacillus subtilis subsp. subtilis]
MVRTQPRVVPLQIEISRVLGWSTALGVHVLALMLLLIPAAYVAAPLPRERIRMPMLVPPVPTPPVPVPIKPDVPTLVQPRTVPKPQVAPLPPPTASAEDVLAVAPLPASEAQAPTLAPSVPAPAGGGEGAQLQYRSAPPPAYPIAAIRNHEQGTVLLRVRVEADGRASSVVIERSSGSRALDNAARQQVLRQWRFVPAKVNGQLVPADGLVPVSFSLPG